MYAAAQTAWRRRKRPRTASLARSLGTERRVSSRTATSGNSEASKTGWHSSPMQGIRPVLQGVQERKRQPCYLAVRLWAVNALDQKSMRAQVVFRVFLLFQARGEALRVFPAEAKSPISSSQSDAWTNELVNALPTLAVQNGKETTDDKMVREFKRVNDAFCVAEEGGERRPLWFPQDEGEEGAEAPKVGLLTYLLEAEIQLQMHFREFPFDRHSMAITLFLPKRHKDHLYEFVCEPDLHLESEKIKPIHAGGKGVFELVSGGVSASLCEWDVVHKDVDTQEAGRIQTQASFCITIQRRPNFWQNKFIFQPGLIATLACLSSVFDPTDIGNRFQTTMTLLLTLTAINYSVSDSLPALPYCTILDDYHDACHYFVLVIILQNVLFHALCQLTTGCPASQNDLLYVLEKLSMLVIFGVWSFYNLRWHDLHAHRTGHSAD